MPYRFATARENYSDYAGGHVFYGLPGHPAFPVRLVSEIFQRCLAIRPAKKASVPCRLYDPCCGGAYHLSVLAYQHWNAIDEIIGSDIDENALSLAQRNLALLTVEGMDKRIAEISQRLDLYRKKSHADALESAKRLRNRLLRQMGTHRIRTDLFRASITDGAIIWSHLSGKEADLVITDIPYAQLSNWQVPHSTSNPIWQLLESLRPVLLSEAIVAIATPKRQRIAHEQYQRVARFSIGKRQIAILQAV